ncbi:hypothetical protein RA2_04471 [Roseovarius sp. A-2]|uniref:hypothetical protein n=1 Tax=Roseovarius sp. A-2 TaxID=1570360 RepID=UPI0009C51480|nr:hypothetical protein [Roseovarius sp. A-2]GAW37388.1 hypothetical protein RA2_04471 [Roseovarius sp. A-2]
MPIPDTVHPANRDWKASLTPGHVVRFRFPVVAEAGHQPVAKRRPCLVLEVFHLSGQRFAKLAYGTSAETRANRGCEVRVNQPDGCAAAGLDRPTRFVGARSIIVSVENPSFEHVSETGSPVMGRLDASLTGRLTVIRKRLRLGATRAKNRSTERKAQRTRTANG